MASGFATIRSTLGEVEEYFNQRADAEYFPDSAGAVGNEEMQLLVEVRQAIRLLAKLEQVSA